MPIDREALNKALGAGRIEWRAHALRRMVERGIAREDAISALRNGEIVEDYPLDTPYPSALFLGARSAGPLHVVASLDDKECVVHVITAYAPGPEHFEDDFKTRRNKP